MPAGSMHSVFRNKRAAEIQASNEKLLRRLQDSKSVYDVTDWEKDRSVSKYRLRQISKYEPSILERSILKRKRRSISSGDPLSGGQSLLEQQDPNKMLYDLYKKSIEQDPDEEASKDELYEEPTARSVIQTDGNVILPAIM